MDELIQLVFKSYGIVGVIIFTPVIAVVFLWRHTQTLQERLQTANDKRIEDSQRISDKLMGMASEHAVLAKETNMALDRIGDMMTAVQTQNTVNIARRTRE